MNLDPNSLWASLVWGSVGVAYLIYAKKQGRVVPAVGGLAILVASYFAESALTMSLVGIGLMVAIFFLAKRYD